MDWNLAIERNRAALKRIVAMLVAMAGAEAFTSSVWGGRRPRVLPSASPRTGSASGGGCGDAITPTRRSEGRRPPLKREAKPALILPRHLHHAILRLIRPAESAVRRLVIVMARGLVVQLAPPRPRKARPTSIFLTKPGGTGIYLPAGARAFSRGGGGSTAARPLALPLLDPLPPFHPRPNRRSANGVPRISLPGVTALSAIAPRRPPAPDDAVDATRLALRLAALGAALDDLPRQARRFARWRAARDAAGTRDKNRDAAGTRDKNRDAAGTRDKNRDAAGTQHKPASRPR